MSKHKKMSRSSFLNSIGSIGLLGTFPFLAMGCKEENTEPLIYEGENKNAIISNIMTRRAIRKYKETQVSQEQIDVVIRCAIHAPSSANGQPWEVRIVINSDILKEINSRWVKANWDKEFDGLLANHRDDGFSIFYNAPSLIIISADPQNLKAKTDVGLIMQNILLSAHATGLGTCPIGALISILNSPENSDLLELLKVPSGYEVMGNVALGYPAENPKAPIRYADNVKIIR